jgi:N-methylhydantoinase B
MVLPVFDRGARRPAWFLVNRAHHADVGGAVPGSMGIAQDLYGEGLVIPPVLLCRRGEEQRDVLRLFCSNVRGADERRLDLRAQQASLELLAERLRQLVADFGARELRRYTDHLFDYTERVGRAAIARLRRGTFRAADALEDDGQGNGPLWLRLLLRCERARLRFDWSRSSPQARGGVNANRSVVLAACVYALRCLCPARMPTNDGLFRLVEVATARGTVVDPLPPAPVAGGNVETSQRLVDVCFQALQRSWPGALPACSAGTMSNLSLGSSGAGASFACYETLPGGAGAGPSRSGRAAVQTHMTNTRNTPVEEFEHCYPLRVDALTVRRGSGGRGARRGGDGIEKRLVARQPLLATFLGERHRSGPPGAAGGGAGSPGALWLSSNGRRRRLPSKGTWSLAPGDALTVWTPGGGGHGRA